MNCIVNLAAVASGDIGISYCQEVSTAGFCSAISLRDDTGWGLKQNVIPVTKDRRVVFPQRGESLVKKPRLTSVARWCITKRKSKNTIAFCCLLVNYKRITRGNSSGIRSEIKKYILTAQEDHLLIICIKQKKGRRYDEGERQTPKTR